MILGDPNSRTRREGNMYHENNKYIAELAPENNKKISLKGDRISCDDKTKSSGRKILNICHNHYLNIAYEEILGDRLGNFTYFNNLGGSVEDYLLADSNIWEKILEFKVLDPTFDSKHAPIMAALKFFVSKLERRGKGKKKVKNPWHNDTCLKKKTDNLTN